MNFQPGQKVRWLFRTHGRVNDVGIGRDNESY